jgi:hypothetical protein
MYDLNAALILIKYVYDVADDPYAGKVVPGLKRLRPPNFRLYRFEIQFLPLGQRIGYQVSVLVDDKEIKSYAYGGRVNAATALGIVQELWYERHLHTNNWYEEPGERSSAPIGSS